MSDNWNVLGSEGLTDVELVPGHFSRGWSSSDICLFESLSDLKVLLVYLRVLLSLLWFIFREVNSFVGDFPPFLFGYLKHIYLNQTFKTKTSSVIKLLRVGGFFPPSFLCMLDAQITTQSIPVPIYYLRYRSGKDQISSDIFFAWRKEDCIFFFFFLRKEIARWYIIEYTQIALLNMQLVGKYWCFGIGWLLAYCRLNC